jgi:hypothetical protein
VVATQFTGDWHPGLMCRDLNGISTISSMAAHGRPIFFASPKIVLGKNDDSPSGFGVLAKTCFFREIDILYSDNLNRLISAQWTFELDRRGC